MSILSHRPQALYVCVCLGCKSFLGRLRIDTLHTFKLLGTLTFFFCGKTNEVIHYSLYRHKKSCFYTWVCAHIQCKQTQTLVQQVMSILEWHLIINWVEIKQMQMKEGEPAWVNLYWRDRQHNREPCFCPYLRLSTCLSVCLSVCMFARVSWISRISNTESRKAIPTTRTHHDHRKSRSVWQLCACVSERHRGGSVLTLPPGAS